MAILINDSINVLAPKPLENRYVVWENGSARSYNSTAEILSLNSDYRYKGRTFLLNTPTGNVEYWFKDGITDNDLVIKTTDSSSVVTPPPAPTGTYRYAVLADEGVIPNAVAGDYIIDGSNTSTNDIMIRPSMNNLFTLDTTDGVKKIIIKGGNYNTIRIEVPGLTGTQQNPIIITNYGGQVKCKALTILGLSETIITGKYDATAKTGDSAYIGHDGGYAYSSGKYGIWIDNGWTSNAFLIQLAGSGTSMPSGVTFEYIEAGNGGFSNVFKWDEQGGVMDRITLRDLYFHDIHSENIYLGSTNSTAVEHQFTNLLIENCRFLRGGSDALQVNQLREGCLIQNNVFHGTMNWASPFQAYQDYSLTMSARNGGVTVKNNIFLCAGGVFINLFTNTALSWTASGLVDINNNLFAFSRNDGGFIGGTFQSGIGLRITNNDFAHWNFMYTKVYTNAVENTYIFRIANDAPITISNNNSDGSGLKHSLYVVTGGFTPSITEANNNLNTAIGEVEFMNFMNLPLGFDYLRLSNWTGLIGATYGDEASFPTTNTKKNQPYSYIVDDYVVHKSKVYRCIQAHSTPVEPGVATGWASYWELQTYAGGVTTPPDDVRLAADNIHNGKGRGLLDNPAFTGVASCADPTSLTINSITSNSALASWSGSPSDSSYIWELYSPSIASGTLVASGTITSLAKNLDNLSQSTDYQFRVKINCISGTQSNWVTSSIFTTDAIAVPIETLELAAYDEGNQVALKLGTNRAQYTSEFRLVGVGSSTLAGTGANSPNKVGEQIQTYLNSSGGLFFNSALSGQDTTNVMPLGTSSSVHPHRSITAAIATRPDAILIMLPTNDIANGLSASQFATNITYLFTTITSYGIPCFVTGTQPRDSFSAVQQQALVDTNNLLISSIPASRFINVLDLLRDTSSALPAAINPNYAAGDQIHLNDAGHTILANAINAKIDAYFQDNTSIYDQYVIEYGTTSNTGVVPSSWTTLDTITDVSNVTPSYSRIDNSWYGYRFKARKVSDSTYTSYSNVVYLKQDYLRDSVDQTVQVDFSVDTNGAPPADWSNLNAPSSGSVVGTVYNLTDNLSAATNLALTVTKVFFNAGTGGATSGIYPTKAMQDNWGMSPTLAEQCQVTVSGLEINRAYEIEFISSRSLTATTDNRACGMLIDGKWFNGSVVHVAGIANTNKVGTIKGIVTTSGTITLDLFSTGSFSYINAMVIRRFADTVVTPTCSDPTGVTIGSITDTSASLGYSGTGVSYDWELYDTAIGGTLINSGNTANSSVSFTGLTASTTYQARVRSNCSNGATSNWVNSSTFTTAAPPSSSSNIIDVNIYSGSNPTIDTRWNNWNVSGGGSFSNGTSNNFKFEDGSLSGISGTFLVAPYGISDNGATYGGGVWDAAVLRYGMYTTNNSYLTTVTSFKLSGLDTAKTYDFEFTGSRNNTGNSVQVQCIGTNTVTSATLVTDSNKDNSVTCIGLQPNIDGEITIKWIKGSGSYGYINAFKVTVQGTGTSCSQPSSASVGNITTSSADLTWSAATNGNTYDWELYTPNVATGTLVTNGNTSTTSVSASSLTASTDYQFRIRTNCTGGNSPWLNVAGFQTAANLTCGVVTGLTTGSITSSSATISWSAPTGAGTFDYEVYTPDTNGTLVASGNISGTSVNITGLTASTNYQARVRTNCTNGAQSTWVTGTQFGTSGTGSSSSTWQATTTPYNGSQLGYMYTPSGYNDGNSNNYPLIIFLHGSGERGSNPSGILGTGLPQMINNGQVMNCLVWCPQLSSASNTWLPSYVKAAYDWVTANYRVDLDRVYVTGLSLGASGTWDFTKAYTSLVAAYATASGYYVLNTTTEAATMDAIKNVPGFFVHGDMDSTQNSNNTKTIVDKFNAESPRGKFAPMVQYVRGQGHSSAVWNDWLYDKSKAPYDFESWFLQHSRQDAYTADGYVDLLEAQVTASNYERALHTYTIAKTLVDALPADSNQVVLQSRYAAAKSTIDTNYGKRYIVDIGANSTAGNYNINSGATGATTSNLVDYNGGSSTYGFTIVAQSGSSALAIPGMDNTYFGVPGTVWNDGRSVVTNGGTIRFTGLNNAKQYDVLVFGAKDACAAGNNAVSPELTAIYNGVAKWILCAYNTRTFAKFTSITPSSGQIDIAIKAGWALNSGVTATREESGDYTTASSNVSNYTSRGVGVLSMVILIEK